MLQCVLNLIVELSRDLDSLKRKYPKADIIDARGKIMLPTFFNAHFNRQGNYLPVIRAAETGRSVEK